MVYGTVGFGYNLYFCLPSQITVRPSPTGVGAAAVAAEAPDQTMEQFLSQLFLPAEAATYAVILSGLGFSGPKDLAAVNQESLVSAGIKKFHARKIVSAEIYRAFL